MSKETKIAQLTTTINNSLNRNTDKFNTVIEGNDTAIIEYKAAEQNYSRVIVRFEPLDFRKTLDHKALKAEIITKARDKFRAEANNQNYTEKARFNATAAYEFLAAINN